jgi:hypothetical protein
VIPAVRRVLASLAHVVCPPEASELGLIDAIVDHVGLTMSALPPLFRNGLVAGALTYDLGAIPFHGRRAHKLTGERAVRYFESWLHGPTPLHRQLALALRQVLALAHYEQPVVQERMGYRPQEWIEKVKTRRLAVYADDIARHQQSLIAPDPLPGRAPFKKKVVL